MSINYDQLIATASAGAVVLASVGATFTWIGRRVSRNVAAAAKLVTDEASVVLTATLIGRMDHSDQVMTDQIDELKKRGEEDRLEMAKQFGGNSGGIRQAIDGVAGTVSEVREKVANLEGRFDQHLKEGAA